LTADLSFSSKKYPSPNGIPSFLDDLKRQISRLPGVQGVAFSVAAPFGGGVTGNVKIRGHEWLDKSTEPSVGVVPVTEDYFNVMGTRLLQGRYFAETDDLSSGGAVIINEKFARLFFPDQDTLGQVITNFSNKGMTQGGPKEHVIVGVVESMRGDALDQDPMPVLYLPYRQAPWGWGELVIRTKDDSTNLIPSIREEIKNADPSMGHVEFDTIEKRISDSIIPQKFNLLLLTIFAGIGVVLAAVGVYGVMYYRVIGSVREIGVRMALGAQGRDLLRAILGQGMLLTIIGLGIGVLAALGLTRLMESLLYGIKPTDSVTFVSVGFTFMMIALLACYIPARRATKVDPMTALRCE
jgi:putative ABC transport system permease protein